MARLPQTTEVLAEFSANNQLGPGGHRSRQVTGGEPGISVGSTDFKPGRHSTRHINPLARPGFTNEYRVKNVIRERPLAVNIVGLYDGANEHPEIVAAKAAAQVALKAAVDDAYPHVTDRRFMFSVGSNIPEDTVRHDKRIETDDSGNVVAGLARDGLTFVVGNLRHLVLPEGERFGELVAVKIDHPSQRALPVDGSRLAIGGLVEIRPSQVLAVNEYLADQHQAVVDSFENRGAQVVSLITDPSYAEMFNVAAADQAIAQALRQTTGA